MRWRFRSALFLAAASVVSTELLAQQRFTSSTSLLVLDVSVLDRDGNPVTDLRPEDLVVTLNGEKEPVRTMVFLATQTTKATAIVPGASVPASASPTNRVDVNSEPDPKLLVILVDDMSIYPTDSKGLFVAAERFVDTIPSRDWVGLASTSGRLTVNPSLDRTPLLAKLKRAFGWMNDPRREIKPYVGLMEAQEVDLGSQAALRNLFETSCGLPPNLIAGMNLGEILTRYDCPHQVERQARDNATFARVATRNQLDTYTAVINAMMLAPGVKQLVILTGGVALAPGDSVDFVAVAKAASAAGVQMTILMEEPDDSDLSNPFAREYAKDQRRMLQQAQTLAEMSGGQFFRVIGQADRFYQRVLTSASAIYRIGVDVPKRVPPDGNYKLTVTINRPGVKVLASRYAAPPPPPAALTPDEEMTRAIRNGQLLYGVPVQMSAEAVRPEGGAQLAIRVSVEVPGDTPGPLSGMFGMIGPEHKLRSGPGKFVRSADGKSYHLDFLVPAVAATYDLRFAVVDGSGAVGATVQKVVVK
jgi:VWFA-related protein